MNTLPAPPLLPTAFSLKAVAQSSGLVLLFINQASIPLYEVYSTDGELLHLSIAEQFDNPAGWRSRTEAEQDAMMTLALDDYYGKMTWDEEVAIPVLPV
ncbi:hypothetical protein [uncultured Fibrella sp.]|uniref:hypothetical protein n=1 Tax=uncultured Fibrella sp. TaxID=1284596 RepID=UPI0035C9F911